MPRIAYHPRMLQYSFGPDHPFKPERLRRAMDLLTAVAEVEVYDPGPGLEEDLSRVHDPVYVEAVETGRTSPNLDRFGFGPGDNPAFEGMHGAALAYTAGTLAAAREVRDGARIGLTLGGGLHHAQRAFASGFCIYNDPAMAISILRERFERIAYIDIDLHHGDGVQAIYLDDPQVLTCSIHQDGRTLYPGSGFVHEVGRAGTSVNVPLAPGTSGDVWLGAFERGILAAVDRFQPEAVVLEMGADPHFMDPLGHLQVSAQEWIEAVRRVRDLGLPLVACGGGGYSVDSVVRMWAAAALTLCDLPVPDRLPADHHLPGGSEAFWDILMPPRGHGDEFADRVLSEFEALVLPGIPTPS